MTSQQASLFAAADQGFVNAHIRPELGSWRAAARQLLADEIEPARIHWSEAAEAATPSSESDAASTGEHAARVPKAFAALARCVACARTPDRWALLYQLVWRLTHGEPALLALAADPDVRRANALAKSVRRDLHKMKAFARFREVPDDDGSSRFVAWFEPEHLIVELASGFFARRFASMRWSILTPDRCAHFDPDSPRRGRGHDGVWFSAGTHRLAAPDSDRLEDAWRTYYRSIFNPARLKVSAMMSEMPVKYWKNLPEAREIGALIHGAHARSAQMQAAPDGDDTLRCGPTPAPPAHALAARAEAAAGLDQLAARAAACQACALHACATQTVFGEGPERARVMLVGEQPGDAEDLAGRPFVGPAGRLLDGVMADAGLPRESVYVTNAVKHFKFEPRGKRRLHRNPSQMEAEACLPWLQQEIDLIRPALIVCLGKTAAQNLLGPNVRVTRDRGKVIDASARQIMVTLHPAHVLRAGADGARLRDQLLGDLRLAASRSAQA